MKLKLALAAATIALSACSGNTSSPQAASGEPLQCGKDTDCKGDRVCDAGKCASPATANAAANPQSKPVTDASPISICKAGDGLKPIPVWTPDVDPDGNLSSDPPGKDGQIVYISLFQSGTEMKCDDKTLNSFSRPDDIKDKMAGGLAVNLKGNAQFANGTCFYKGYFMNEDVQGMHQGWMETYYGAVDKAQLMMAGKHCLERSID